MSTHDPDRPPTELAPFARDAADQLDRRVAQARPAPDFAAMLARARELDPGAVAAEAVARAEALPPVIPLAQPERRSDAAALAPFTAALRAELDERLAERRMASIPPPPLPRRRRVGVALGVFAALAAALLLAVLGPDLVARRAGERPAAAALDGAGGQPDELRPSATTAGPADEPRAVEPRPEHVEEDMSSQTGPIEHVPDDMPETADEPPAPEAPRKHAGKDGPRRRKPADEPRVAPAGLSLEDEAQLLWQRGELAAAERKYREIVAHGGDKRAELAFGDLFALARQLRGGEGQAAAWREYLARFPAGRFADDARAGLCRRGPTDARADCWRDYLEHHPAGAHRKQAEAALAGAGAAEAP